jgi:S1-C subfamily serine protease
MEIVSNLKRNATEEAKVRFLQVDAETLIEHWPSPTTLFAPDGTRLGLNTYAAEKIFKRTKEEMVNVEESIPFLVEIL